MDEEKQEEVRNSQKDRYIIFSKSVGDYFRQQFFIPFFLIFISFYNISNSSTLNLSISANPSRLNPILATDSASGQIADFIFSSLVKYDKYGHIIPDIAKSFKFISPIILEFELKNNIFWQDGHKVTTDDIIFTYNSIINPKNLTPLINNFKHIKKLEKISDKKIRVIYKYPYFKALEIWMSGILPYHILKDEKDLIKSKFNFNPIGTGRYKLENLKISANITLKAFENFYIHKPNIDKINFQFIPDSGIEFLMLKNGKLDIGSLTPIQVDRQLNKNFHKNYQIINNPSFGYTYIGFNLKKKKFKNIEIRKAITLAIDKQEIIDILFFGYGKICNGPFLPNSFAYNKNLKFNKFNPEKAKDILKKLGFNKNNPFKFELITNANNKIRVYTAQIIQQQLKKVGIEMKIRVLEWQAFLNSVVHPRKFETVMLGWGLSLTPDAYSIWHSKSDKQGGFNFVGYKNSKVDKLIEDGNKEIDRKKLAKIYQNIFKLIVNDMPYVFLYIPDSIQAVSKKIKNIEPTFLGISHNQIDWIK